jgi:hypothetical protein
MRISCTFSSLVLSDMIFGRNCIWPGILSRTIYDMITEARHVNSMPCYMESMIVGCWTIWNHRNKIIF